MKTASAIILAGGNGERLRPLTRRLFGDAPTPATRSFSRALEGMRSGPYDRRLSSSAFAATRSVVPKPSVNRR